MTETMLKIADKADIIVNGYAFTIEGDHICALNLNRPHCATVFSMDGEVLETSMEDIELDIVQNYLQRNRKYLGV